MQDEEKMLSFFLLSGTCLKLTKSKMAAIEYLKI